MKKRNVFVKSAVATALLALSVSAMAVGIGSTSNTTVVNIAKEAFGTLVTAATPIATSANGITYTFATPGGIVINPGGEIYLTIQATGGALSSTGSLALIVPETAGGNLKTSTATISGGVITVVLKNSDTVGNTNTVLGVGASIVIGKVVGANSPAGATGLITVSNTGLAAGTSVTVSGKVGVTVGGDQLETASPAANLLTSSTAVTSTATITGTEVDKIDLSSLPITASRLTDGATVPTYSQTHDLGSVRFADATTVANQLDAVTPVNVASATAFSGVVAYELTKLTGAWTPGATYSVNSAAGCAVGTNIASTQVNAPVGAVTVATTKVTLTTAAGVRPVAGTPVYLCATYPVAAIAPNKLAVVATLQKINANYLDVVSNSGVAVPLYDLQNNGKTIFVRNLVAPSRDVDGGYQGSVRITNTGTIAAPVTATWIDPDTGLATASSAVLNFGTTGSPINFPAGGVKVFSAKQIEALTGTAPLGLVTQPRLKLTAPTDGLEAQTFILTNATGNFSDISNAQVGQ